MHMRRTFRSLGLTAAAGLLLLAPAAVAAATPVENGCPASTELYSVVALEASGPYQLPRRLDDPANGGNGDGWVCAFPMPEAMHKSLGFQIYQFFENNSPAQGRP
jgi:hypothetical protein